MNNKIFIAQIRDLIAHDEIAAALEQLRTLLDNSPKLDEVLHQSGRFENIRQQIRLDIVSQAAATLTQNQIRVSLLELVSEIEKGAEQSADATSSRPDTGVLRAEIERAISIVNSKNVMTGNIQAGGNVHIGDVRTTQQNADKIYNIEKIDKANFS